MARKLSDSGTVAYGRPSPSFLLDTGFSGTFDIRAKIEALEKKTNNKMSREETAHNFLPENGRGELKASATLILSPKPVTPPGHRSIQVVSQTPRGITQNANSSSARLSPSLLHPSHKTEFLSGGRRQPARDALWSVKSVSDTDDRLTDIVASNRRMLHSDDTIERFTDFELGSSYDDIFVAESVEKRRLSPFEQSNRLRPQTDVSTDLQSGEKLRAQAAVQTKIYKENISENHRDTVTGSNNESDNAVGSNQPKSILKSKSRDNNVPKESSLPRTKTLATQRERDLRRSTSRGRHGTPSRTPLPESSTTSSSDTDDGHFIPFTTERDDVLRDPISGSSKRWPTAMDPRLEKEYTHQKMPTSLHPINLQRYSGPVSSAGSHLKKASPNLESTSENESLFSGDDVSAPNSVSLATSMEHLSSGAEYDSFLPNEEEGNTNDVTLTLPDSVEFDDAERTLEFKPETDEADIHPVISMNILEDHERSSPKFNKNILALPLEDDHGDSDTLEPISASGFYGVKSDIPFSSKKRKINNRKSGQKISQMTSIWSKMPLSTNILSPKGANFIDSSNRGDIQTPRHVQDTNSLTTKMRKTSLGLDTPRSNRESAESNPVVVVDPPDFELNSPNPQERKKSWTETGTKEKLDELFGKLNSKLKSREGSSASTSPQDEMLGEQKFETGFEVPLEEHFHTQEEEQDVEVSYEEDYDQRRDSEDASSPQFLAPFDSSVDAIQRSHSQPVLSSRDDMSYYDQSRSIHEYIATDEQSTSEKTKNHDSKEKRKHKINTPEASHGFWEIPGTPRKNMLLGGNDVAQNRDLYTETDVIIDRNNEHWCGTVESRASTSSSEQRGDAMSNLSNRSMINSESDYDEEQVDPLTCAADYVDYSRNQYVEEGVSGGGEMFSNSTGFSMKQQTFKGDIGRKESVISMASNFSTTSNQGSVSVGNCGNSGRAPPGDHELVQRHAHTEEWLVEDIRRKGASPRVSSVERTSDIPSTASSIVDSMSAATAGSVCELDEEDMPDSYVMEEGVYEEYVDGGDYYDGQGFHCDQSGQVFYHGGERTFDLSNIDPEDELKLELGFLNNSSEEEEEEEFHGEVSGSLGVGGEFSSDKCVYGSSHHNYTDSSDDYNDFIDQNDTVMYNEQYPDDYSDESGEILGDIIQTMDELGDDILQYLSDEMEEEGEVEEWGEEDLETYSDRNNLENHSLDQQEIIPYSQSPREQEALERGLSDSDGLVFYTPNNVSCGIEALTNLKSEIAEDNRCEVNLDLVSSDRSSQRHNQITLPALPKPFNNFEDVQSPIREKSSDGPGRRRSSQCFVEVMTDSARLREQFKEHHGHIDDKDIVHVDSMSGGQNLPDNDEFFISFEIDEAHRLSYRQYDDTEGRSPEEAYYEYLQQADHSTGAVSSDPDNVFTQESPMTSLNDSNNKYSLQSNHTTLSTTTEDNIEVREIGKDKFCSNEEESNMTVDFAQKQNLLTEIRTHYQNKDIKKKLVAELKHFDFKSLKPAEADQSVNNSGGEAAVGLSPVLPSVVRRLSHEYHDETVKKEFPPNIHDVERLDEIKPDRDRIGINNMPSSLDQNATLLDKHGNDNFETLKLSQGAVSNTGTIKITQISSSTASAYPIRKTSDVSNLEKVHSITSFSLNKSESQSITSSNLNNSESQLITNFSLNSPEHRLTMSNIGCTESKRDMQVSDDKRENHLPIICTGREAATSGPQNSSNFMTDNDQTFSKEEASGRRRSFVDITGSKLNLSKERRRRIRSFWEQLDDEKQKKKEEEERWHRRRSDLKLKQVYPSQSLAADDSQAIKKHSIEASEKASLTKAMSQDSASQSVSKKPPPPPVAPKPAKHNAANMPERIIDRGVSVKKMAQQHENDNLSEGNDTMQNRRSRRKAQVNHSELATAIMKRQKELARQNLAVAAAQDASSDASKSECLDIPLQTAMSIQDAPLITERKEKEKDIEDSPEVRLTAATNSMLEDSVSNLYIVTTESEKNSISSQSVVTPPPPQPPPPLQFQDAITPQQPDFKASQNLPPAENLAQEPASILPKQPTKAFNVPRPSFNAKTLAKSNTFLPSFARRSHTDIPTSLASSGPTHPSGDFTTNPVQVHDATVSGISTSDSSKDLNPGSVRLPVPNSEPAPVTKEMKLWVTDYLKDMIGEKHRRGLEVDSFGSRVSSESTSVNTSFSANTSFYGHLPMHSHHKDPPSIDLQLENSSSPRPIAAPAGKLSIADRINKIQEKMNCSKESIKESDQLRPTQSQQQFASLLQNRLINVIAQEGDEERDEQAKSRKPPPSAWALERQRLFGKGRIALKSEDWGEPNSTSTPTTSDQTGQSNDPSTQFQTLSQSLTQSDVIKMSTVLRGRKHRGHTAGGTIFDIVENFNSPDSSSTESITPIERTRPNSPWVAKAGGSPQPPVISQLVNKLTPATESDKSVTERQVIIGNVKTLVSAGHQQPHALAGSKQTSLQQQTERDAGAVISGTFDKSVVSELLKKVELSEDESGSTSLSNSSSFQAGCLRKHSLEGSKIAELKLKLTSESRSSSNSSLFQDQRPYSAGGESGLRNIITRLDSPSRGARVDEVFPRNQQKPFSWKPLSVIPVSDGTGGHALSESHPATIKPSSTQTSAPPVAPKNKRMYNERRHTTQVNFDELREKYNSMTQRREHQTPPQSNALWAIDAASSRLNDDLQPQYHAKDTNNESCPFGVVQSSVFTSSNKPKNPVTGLPSRGLQLKTEHSVVDESLPAEPESPLMTSSARQPPGFNLAQFSLQNSIKFETNQNMNCFVQDQVGIKELEPDNDTVYSPLSSARVPEAYNLPVDVVPTPDPWLSTDHFREDVSFGELAESESSDTFEFLKKRTEIKEEFLLRQQNEKQQLHPQRNQHQHQQPHQQEQDYQQSWRQQQYHSSHVFQERAAVESAFPSTSYQLNQKSQSSSASCSQSQPQQLRHNFPETIIDTRTATGHVVCRVLSETPLEPDESGIGGSDHSLGSGSTGVLERAGAYSQHSIDRHLPRLPSQSNSVINSHLAKSSAVSDDRSVRTSITIAQTAGRERAWGLNQQEFSRHSQEDFQQRPQHGGDILSPMGDSQSSASQSHKLTSPRRASVHEIQLQPHFSPGLFPPSQFATSPVRNIASTASSTSLPIGSFAAVTTSSLLTASASTISVAQSQGLSHPEVYEASTCSSNPSPTASIRSSSKGERASKTFGDKEKRRRSKSKFMQEIEKKRNASEPTGHDSPGAIKKSNRKANLSSSDVPSGQLNSFEEATSAQSMAVFGPRVARKKSSGAMDGLEGEATTNTMQGYSKRFDRLWARFDPDQPRGPTSPEEKPGSRHAHENGTSLHAVSFLCYYCLLSLATSVHNLDF